MEYHRLGGSGLEVSALCLGTLMFGSETPDDEAAAIVASAKTAGVNFIDTADMYSDGGSEVTVGGLLRPARDAWVLATKVGNPVGTMPMEGGLSRRGMFRSIEASLRRLGTDRVDIWYLHLPDRLTRLEETLGAIADVIRSGKALYWGFSNYRGWEIAELVRVADLVGAPRPAVCQAYYNLVNRMPEYDVLPACAHFGIGVATYSPLARGVLTAKYRADAPPPEGSRASRNETRIMQAEFRPESFDIAARIADYAGRHGMTSIDFALRWLLNNANVASVVTGPRTLAQWQAYVASLQHGFSTADEAFVDGLVTPGHASTPGFVDPKFPPQGRIRLRSQ